MTLRMELMQRADQWEEFLTLYAPQSLFQSWLWGEVQQKTGTPVERMGFFDGKELVGIAQITIVRAKRGTFLHVRHGPIWKAQKYWSDFVHLMTQKAKKEGAWFVRVSPLLTPGRENLLLLQRNGFTPAPTHEVDAERCWVLDIDKSEEELLMGMRKTTRYEIKHAQHIKIEKSKEIDRFIRLYDETSARHNFVQHLGIREEFDILDCDLFVASYDSRDLAAAIIVYYGGQAIYHHGASLPSKIPASYSLQWVAMKEAKKRGKKLYNFWGIAPDDKQNHPWRGITSFKKGFGGREVHYLHSHDLQVSPLYIIPKMIELVRKKIRGY